MARKAIKKVATKKVLKKSSTRFKLGKDVDLDKEVILDKLGKRITNARAEQISRRAINRVVGRPSLTGPERVSPEIKARVPAEVKRQINQLAKSRKQSVSEIVRAALEKYLRSA